MTTLEGAQPSHGVGPKVCVCLADQEGWDIHVERDGRVIATEHFDGASTLDRFVQIARIEDRPDVRKAPAVRHGSNVEGVTS